MQDFKLAQKTPGAKISALFKIFGVEPILTIYDESKN
jgi:hypothetical protein